MKFDLKIPHCSKIFWHTAWHTERLKSVKLLFYINKKWRTVRDSNPRDGFPPTHFPGVRLRPLGQLSSRRCYQLKKKNCNPLVFVFLKLQVLIMLSGFLIQISLCAKGISTPSLANLSAIR